MEDLSVGLSYQKMKTIFGHAMLPNEDQASVSCVCYDRSSEFFVTGADDKLVKIWLSTNGSLQAVLHGH